ncbi:UDP-glucuronosyl/UDP-glucosyltransferase [Corchorus olitorius]|uniref:UDP-glucuronosyl/UDP-glucosyltransferase n=1 Tax=Corchorus olitorius TaxID=93759 RepID=A0A1R3JF66_9ROSI|nr:UDP-glucuronosyl/UDP-glucosyltransferase [Corchorus olitorius]
MEMSSESQIWVVPFFGQGHLFPSMELCKHIASRNFNTTFIISSNLLSSVPASFQEHPLIDVAEIPSSPPSTPPEPNSDIPHHPRHHHSGLTQGIEKLLENASRRPACAVIDVMMDWTGDAFKKFNIPTIGFLTSGACASTLEYAMWKDRIVDIKPGETRLLPGLPEEMALTDSDLKRGPPPPGVGGRFGFRRGPHGPPPPGHGFSHGPPGGPGPQRRGPPQRGGQPPWVEVANHTVALMINSCNELEGPFLAYLANQIGKPVWGVGPLLPQELWKSSDSLLHDREIRANKQSNVTEDEVMEWLDSKPRGSVLYVSFGSEVAPTKEELEQLADALEASNRPFIWVIQPGSGRPRPPPGPPQFLGNQPDPNDVPMEADPESYFPHVGCRISENPSQERIMKDDITNGIEKLMGNDEFKKQAVIISDIFHHGFPASSAAALDAFKEFILNQNAN